MQPRNWVAATHMGHNTILPFASFRREQGVSELWGKEKIVLRPDSLPGRFR